jgi:hypothetical protein
MKYNYPQYKKYITKGGEERVYHYTENVKPVYTQEFITNLKSDIDRGVTKLRIAKDNNISLYKLNKLIL